jgi:serine/threonine protein kinase
VDPLLPSDPPRIGNYRLIARLGAGGMGQVYLARTASGRHLVIKAIRTDLAQDPEFRARFAREADAARKVGGFHTAQVVDADPDADTPWIATTHIPGPTLTQAVRNHGPIAPPALHALAVGLAEGIQAVHACDLVHRDLKPDNIILADDGPRIIDFGIARPLDADSMTTQGTVFGTLPYMSPEQTDGSRVGPASDVFSLGTVLAFAATGTSPFAGATIAQTLRRLISPPPDPGDIDPGVEALIVQCWNHDPTRRPTPDQIIIRFEGLDLQGSWPPPHAFGVSWAEPRTDLPPPVTDTHQSADPLPPGASYSAGTAATDLNGTLRRTTVQEQPPVPKTAVRPQPTPAGAGSEREEPGQKKGWYIGAAIAIVVVLALLVWSSFEPGTGEPSTSESGVLEPSADMILEHNGSVRSVAFSSDGDTLATGSANTAWLWSVDSGGQIGFTGNEDWVGSVDFTFDDDTLPIENGDTARLWYADTGDETVALVGHSESQWPAAFSPDGATLVTTHVDGAARLWDVDTGDRIGFTGHYETGVYAVAFSPDGQTLALGHNDGTAQLWDVDTGDEIATFTGHDDIVSTVVFSPDGDTLATGASQDGTARLWDIDTGEQIASFAGHERWVSSVAFGPDGTTLATTDDTTARVWDIDTGEQIASFTGHISIVRSVAFSPDGTTLATGADDRTVQLWPLD